MTSHKILFTLSLLIASHRATAQYDTYELSEEEGDHEDEKPREDYSKYFGGLGAVVTPGGPTQAAASSAGFVQPLDFNGFFAGGHFGLDGLAGGSSQQLFSTPSVAGIALPLSSGVLPIANNPAIANTSGFVVNDIKFPSLFDSSGSGSETGFRPQDFLRQESRLESTSQSSFYSPEFGSLKSDVDREVDYQRKEENGVERSRADNRRDHEYEIDEEGEEGDDIGSFEFDDGPETEYRTSHKQNKKPPQNERQESHVSPGREGSNYKTPYSTVNQVNLQGPTRPRPNVIPKRQYPSSSVDGERNFAAPVNYQTRQHGENFNDPPINDVPPKYNAPYPRAPPKQPYYPPPQYRQTTKQYHSPQKTPYLRPINNEPSYRSAQLKYPPAAPRARNYNNLNKPPVYFRPSARDPYLDNPKPIPNERISSGLGRKQQHRDGIDSLPQTEYATVVEKTSTQPSKNKKECKKISKKIDPNDFARFKRQQMTCYICTNKEKGNTYEECSYESDPKQNSFYKGSAEAYSSDTILTPVKYHIRERRSAISRHNLDRKKTYPQVRKVRQYDYEYDPDQEGHGPEHYKFGPEYFKDDGKRQNVKRKPQKPEKRTDYDEEYDENEDAYETDEEKEYEPPGAGENDDCHKVNRNGLICMVCQKPDGRGTYEQCSYASDPDANRYEYAKSSSYGSKRPQDNRNKRYTGNHKEKKRQHKRHSPNKRNVENKKYLSRRGDFRNGKLKRKKVIKGDYKMPVSGNNEKTNSNTSNEEEYSKVVGLDPFFYGSSETYNPDDYDERGKKIKRRDDTDEEAAASSVEEEEEEAVPTFEDSFYRLFPELVGTDPYTGEAVDGQVKDKTAIKKRDSSEHSEIPYEEVEDEEESESVQNSRKVKPGFEYGLDLPDYYFNDDDDSKKDLEKTLDEFTHKNRSDCKKVMKDKMTCFQCINKNGLQHEECMFVAASEPKSKHLAYHEVKEFRVVPTEMNVNGSTVNSSEVAPIYNNYDQNMKVSNMDLERPLKSNDNTHLMMYKIPRKTKKRMTEDNFEKFKDENKGTISAENIDGETLPAAVTNHDILKILPKEVNKPFYTTQRGSGIQREKRNPKREYVERRKQIKRREPKEEEVRDGESTQEEPVKSNYNAVPPDPESFDEREGPEGAYSHETEPVYDKVLKITLPRYMLTRSEHEDVFDEVLRSG